MLSLYPWQQSQWQQVLAAAARNKLPHALLLTGPEGIGLGHFAACLAARLLCQQPGDSATSCGVCKACILYTAGNHPDFMHLQPEEKGKQLRIDSVREMIDYLHLSSQYRRHKVVVINPADAMNRNAANSLLKTLEEPPPESLLLLLSHRPSFLPVTVRSRCQRINFNPGGTEQALAWLQTSLGGAAADYGELLALARGAPLKVVEIFRDGQESYPRLLLEDLREIHRGTADPVRTAERWQGWGINEVLQWLVLYFCRIARYQLSGAAGAPDNSRIFGYLQELANDLDLQQAVACYELALKNFHAATGPIALNKQGLLEDIIVYWQNLNHRG
jgi:DNA polymerase-3 subunit delta'